MHESDTYLMILEEGEAMCARDDILIVGEERLGPPPGDVPVQLASVTDLERLKRILRRAATAATWQEIMDTP